ncbi:MAG: glycosyltransferase [Paraglaciecola sp.]|nr:glycosyltransferase [Paraglaciecola sp.]
MSFILFVSAEFPPCGGGGVGRVSAIARHLADTGHHVTVITASENNYSILDSSLLYEHPNLQVVRVYSPLIKTWQWRLKKIFPFINFDDNYILWRAFAIKKAKKLHRKIPFDAVISSYPFVSNHAVAYAIVKAFSLPWCADYRDPPWWMYSDTHKQQNQFFNYAKYATHNIVTTPNAKMLLSNKLSVANSDISVVQNGCSPVAATMVLSKPVEFEFLHSGSFYEVGRDINDLIKAVDVFPNPIKLSFIGDAPYPSTKSLLTKMVHPERVSFTGYMSSTEVLTISAATYALVVIQGPLFTNQVPGKVYEYLALQKPILVITNKGSSTYQVLTKEPNVFFAEYGDVNSIQQAIVMILQHKAVDVDRNSYTRDKMVEQFSMVLHTNVFNINQS